MEINDRDALDLVVANGTSADNISVFLNTLVGGAHRVGLTGVETVSGLDFAIQPLNLPPTVNEIEDPPAILEDDPQQSIPLSGITAGENEDQRLLVLAFSDNADLIPNPTVTPRIGTAPASGTRRPASIRARGGSP